MFVDDWPASNSKFAICGSTWSKLFCKKKKNKVCKVCVTLQQDTGISDPTNNYCFSILWNMIVIMLINFIPGLVDKL